MNPDNFNTFDDLTRTRCQATWKIFKAMQAELLAMGLSQDISAIAAQLTVAAQSIPLGRLHVQLDEKP